MSRPPLPTIEEIAIRLANDPPVENWARSLCAELITRGEHEAAAMIGSLCKMLFEAEKAVLVARDGLQSIVDYGDGIESPATASNTLRERPEYDGV